MNKKIAYLVIVIILCITGIVFVYIAKNSLDKKEELNIVKDVVLETPEEHLSRRFAEYDNLTNQREFSKAYDYRSPELQLKETREEYIKKSNELSNKMSDAELKLNLENQGVTIDGNVGYMESVVNQCKDGNCEFLQRVYLKFIKINDEWFLMLNDDNKYCIREESYEMPEEFKRVVSLIVQRHEQEKEGEFLKDVRNCLKIEYADSKEDINNAEGVFEYYPSQALGEYIIKVAPQYSIQSDLITAILLVHEMKHVEQFLERGEIVNAADCFERETDALYSEGHFLASVLNEEERNTIFARAYEDEESVAFKTIDPLVRIPKMRGEDTYEKASNFIQNSKHYQEQCNQY